MERIIVDRYGKVIAGPTTDEKAIVAAGRQFIKAGNVEVSVFYSNTQGAALAYDQKNSAKVFKR